MEKKDGGRYESGYDSKSGYESGYDSKNTGRGRDGYHAGGCDEGGYDAGGYAKGGHGVSKDGYHGSGYESGYDNRSGYNTGGRDYDKDREAEAARLAEGRRRAPTLADSLLHDPFPDILDKGGYHKGGHDKGGYFAGGYAKGGGYHGHDKSGHESHQGWQAIGTPIVAAAPPPTAPQRRITLIKLSRAEGLCGRGSSRRFDGCAKGIIPAWKGGGDDAQVEAKNDDDEMEASLGQLAPQTTGRCRDEHGWHVGAKCGLRRTASAPPAPSAPAARGSVTGALLAQQPLRPESKRPRKG